MTRLQRTERLGRLYAAAETELGRAVEAMESGNKAGALAAMARVTAVMAEISEAWTSGPTLPLLRVH